MPVRRSSSARPVDAPNPVAPAPITPPRQNLCTFTFSNARQCRNPLQSTHPYLCPFHASKDDQALASEQFGKDVAYFLSAQYLSACDLTTALGHLFAALAQGKIKPKTAATLAYLAQTMARTIEISEDEYTNAFGTDDWRKIIRSSVTANNKYLDPDPPSASAASPAAPENSATTDSQPFPPRIPSRTN
ncbi:MAG TPA: hypothetical protein VN982_04740 [Candidatus Dormibacteraeota bacterium]|nr:hypothetical protein [Candidatus Dormibacteraeota bacterium]